MSVCGPEDYEAEMAPDTPAESWADVAAGLRAKLIESVNAKGVLNPQELHDYQVISGEIMEFEAHALQFERMVERAGRIEGDEHGPMGLSVSCGRADVQTAEEDDD